MGSGCFPRWRFWWGATGWAGDAETPDSGVVSGSPGSLGHLFPSLTGVSETEPFPCLAFGFGCAATCLGAARALEVGAAFAAVRDLVVLAGLVGGDTDARISSSVALTQMERKHSSKRRVKDRVTVQSKQQLRGWERISILGLVGKQTQTVHFLHSISKTSINKRSQRFSDYDH